jgi:putative ABC transport system permease protein
LEGTLIGVVATKFDPPPDALAVPWTYLGELAGAAVVATAVAAAIAAQRLRRLQLGQLLREQ